MNMYRILFSEKPGAFLRFVGACLFLIFGPTNGSAQDYDLNSQAEVNAFPQDITSVLGKLDINGPDITDLSPLSNITAIGGNLLIFSNDALTSLEGLQNVVTVGGTLWIWNNDVLTSLEGLQNVVTVGGHLNVWNNDALTNLEGLHTIVTVEGKLAVYDHNALANLDGLRSLRSIGGELNIADNAALTSLEGLSNIHTLESNLQIYINASLTSIEGLRNLTTVSGHVYLSDNDALTDIEGLRNLTTIGDNLNITSNAALTSVDGLRNLRSIGHHLYININDALTDCSGICYLLNTPGAVSGIVSISNNNTGCDNVPEVEASCEDTDGDGIANEDDNCVDTPNPGQDDTDCDTVGDACDLCPGGDDFIDNNNDGLPDCKYPPAYADIVAEWKCGNGNSQKVLVCHNNKTKCYDYASLADHIAHGDYIGPCGNASCGNARGNESAEDREQTATATVSLYPNPASEEAWLDLSAFEGNAFVVRLLDVRGVLIKEINVAEASHEPLRLDLGGLAAGLYFVQVQPEGKAAQTLKLTVAQQ